MRKTLHACCAEFDAARYDSALSAAISLGTVGEVVAGVQVWPSMAVA